MDEMKPSSGGRWRYGGKNDGVDCLRPCSFAVFLAPEPLFPFTTRENGRTFDDFGNNKGWPRLPSALGLVGCLVKSLRLASRLLR